MLQLKNHASVVVILPSDLIYWLQRRLGNINYMIQ